MCSSRTQSRTTSDLIQEAATDSSVHVQILWKQGGDFQIETGAMKHKKSNCLDKLEHLSLGTQWTGIVSQHFLTFMVAMQVKSHLFFFNEHYGNIANSWGMFELFLRENTLAIFWAEKTYPKNFKLHIVTVLLGATGTMSWLTHM